MVYKLNIYKGDDLAGEIEVRLNMWIDQTEQDEKIDSAVSVWASDNGYDYEDDNINWEYA